MHAAPISGYDLTIYWDEIQEGLWFQSLHPQLEHASLDRITDAHAASPEIARVLQYDRPDIVLAHGSTPILVLERTVEVPSGHNVGQRFARLAAAAECGVPVVYFGPYHARKHGGETEGPRYMNLRLFQALQTMADVEDCAVTTINWPVDEDHELIQHPSKDDQLRRYLQHFFAWYEPGQIQNLAVRIRDSEFEAAQEAERLQFVRERVRRPEQYDSPPNTVEFVNRATNPELAPMYDSGAFRHPQTVAYSIGMRRIRSDPYTGMAMLYEYLYANGPNHRTKNMLLRMPHILWDEWREKVRRSPASKEVRLYAKVADAIQFSDRIAPHAELV